MTKTQTFLIKTNQGKECVIRLPINQYGGITRRGFDIIGKRFFDGITGKRGQLKYVLNLEAYSNGEDLSKALEKYHKNII